MRVLLAIMCGLVWGAVAAAQPNDDAQVRYDRASRTLGAFDYSFMQGTGRSPAANSDRRAALDSASAALADFETLCADQNVAGALRARSCVGRAQAAIAQLRAQNGLGVPADLHALARARRPLEAAMRDVPADAFVREHGGPTLQQLMGILGRAHYYYRYPEER